LIQWADIAKRTKEDLEEKLWTSVLGVSNRLTSKQQALRDKARTQELLWYNSKNNKSKK
jgi:hypothetical protein